MTTEEAYALALSYKSFLKAIKDADSVEFVPGRHIEFNCGYCVHRFERDGLDHERGV